MSDEKSDKASDKIIDKFKDKADDSVEDAREGETEDNPLKETVRNAPASGGKDNESEGS